MLLVLFLSTFLAHSTISQGVEEFTPQTSGTKKPDVFEFTFGSQPRICKECCMDILFVLDRSSSIRTDANDPGSNWRLMKSLIADLAAGELNDPRVRVGAAQMGGETESTQQELAAADPNGSGNTGIRFPIQKSGPFPAAMKNTWGGAIGGNPVLSEDDVGAWRTAAEAGLKHFSSIPKPWEANTELVNTCNPANYEKMMIWIVDNGPIPTSNDPCQGVGGAPSLVQQLKNADIQQYIVGVGTVWQSSGLNGRKCMFSAGTVTSSVLKAAADWPQLTPSLFGIDPCNKCNSDLDVVFVLDESGSLCDDGHSPDDPTICQNRSEWDREIDFTKQIVAELSKNWSRTRVALWTFGDEARNIIKLGWTGAPSGAVFTEGPMTGKETHAKTGSDIWSESKVQQKLEELKGDFKEGRTALAIALAEAFGEIEFAPPRADGVKPKKVLIFLTDGGPNFPYYEVDSTGARKTSDCGPNGKTHSGYCMDYPGFWNGVPRKVGPGAYNMAVCTEPQDPKVPWIRYEYTGSKHVRREQTGLDWSDAFKTLDVIPLFVLVGKRRDKHKADLECLLSKVPGKGGIVTPASFEKLSEMQVYRRAITQALCQGGELGESRSLIFQQWTQFENFQQQLFMAKMQQLFPQQFKALQQQQSLSSQTSNVYLSGAMMFCVGVAAYLFGRRNKDDYSLVDDMERV